MEFNLGYGRVSKLDLDRLSSESELDVAADQQRRRLEKAGCCEIFFDVQRGSDDDRPRFEELMQRVRRRDRCERVTITRDDRITRNLRMTLEILDIFLKSKVELVILDDGANPVDLENIYEWKRRIDAGVDAEFEVRKLSLRIRRGFEDLRAQGKANHKVPFGFIRTKEGKYGPHPENYIKVRWLVEQALVCKNIHQLCAAFNLEYGYSWSQTRLRRLLSNPVLRGHTPRLVSGASGSPTLIQYNTHPNLKLISPSEDAVIQQLLEEGSRYRGANQRAKRYPLGSGLCRCARCGTGMTCRKRKQKSGRVYEYMECDNATEYSNPNRCQNYHSIRIEKVEEKVIDALCSRSSELAELAGTEETVTEPYELQAARRQLSDLKKIPGHSTAIQKAIEETESEIRRMEREAESGHQRIPFSKDLLLSYGNVASTPDFWWSLDDEIKRSLYQSLVRDIRVNGIKRPGSRFVDYSIEVELDL